MRLLRLFVALLLPVIAFPGTAGAWTGDDGHEYIEVQRDSAVLFKFIPGRLMFYNKDNERSIRKADSLISAHLESIKKGEAIVKIRGFCTSWPTDSRNMAAAKNCSNQVKSWYIVHAGMKEGYYQTVNNIVPDTTFSELGGRDLVALLYVERVRKPVRPPFVPVPDDLPAITSRAEYRSGLETLRKASPCPVPDTARAPLPANVGTASVSDRRVRKPLMLNIKTNLLYDVVGFPSLEIEIPIGQRFSINAEGAVAWWSGKKRDTFYQLDMLSPEVRWWFGQKSRWQGHYVGAFGAVGLYDLEWRGSRGYQGNYWSAGLSYGYMFPIMKRLSLEAGIGLGVLNTEYEEYLPIDEHYVYQQTSRTVYWGPVKLKLGLVWRIGDGSGKTRRAAL